MKKIITLLSFTLCFYAKAQLINPGFETWTNDLAAPSAMNPNSGNATTGWWDYNMFNSSFVGSSPVSVFRCDTAHSGNYSARIQTVIYTATSHSLNAPWGIPFIGHSYLDTLGILFTGTTNEASQTFKPGIPCTQNLSTFNFYYQYAPKLGDTAECRVLLVNGAAHNPVAGGLVKITTATSTWTQATINFFYVSGLTPDTLYVLFSSSSLDKKPKAGSVFLIDDASVTSVTGIKELLSLDNSAKIYPNPNNGYFTIEPSTSTKQTVALYDVNGKMVLTQSISGKTQIDVSLLSEGVYNLSLLSSEGITNRRLVIVK
ncbi:MAG: T9SS type A sorting domain-containing protein [Bacteroidia bacterium]